VHKPLTDCVHPSVCFWVLLHGRIPSSNTYYLVKEQRAGGNILIIVTGEQKRLGFHI